MTTQLRLYNHALRISGERKIASLSENREPRRLLDDVWDDGFKRAVLEQGYWNFATRTREASYNPSIEPSFGFRRAIDKPSDWVRTVSISSDEYFAAPLLDYHDEGEYWYCDLDTAYIRYVSDDSSYGGDLSLWPESVATYAAYYLAVEIAGHLTASESKIDRMEKKMARALTNARSKDAMNQAPAFPPMGSWTSSRGHGGGRRDRGNRGALTG